MNNPYSMYPYPNPYYSYVPICNCNNIWGPGYWNMSNAAGYPNQHFPHSSAERNKEGPIIKDYGREPFVININQAAKQNNTYRDTIWTGNHLQVTLMSINVGEDIGLEIHPNVDQFLRIEEGQGLVQMGKSKDNLNFVRDVGDDYAIIVPAGTWHNVTNTGNTPLKLYSIYAPPNHPFGTVHRTKADAMAGEEGHSNGNGNTVVFGRTPDEWIRYTEFLVKEGLEDVKRGINMTHILQEFILMGVLVGKGYSPEKAYKTVEEWERTGESKLLQQSKNM